MNDSTEVRRRQRGPCSVQGCDRIRNAKGLCGPHYWRWRNGQPLGELRRYKQFSECSVDGCARPHQALGYCELHYARLKRTGDVGEARPRRQPGAGSVRLTPQGYLERYLPETGSRVLVHREVMEQMIGRPLRAHETVHHKNAVRTDNRPENLELWTSRHTKGARVDDLVRWVVDLYPDVVKQVLEERS